MSASTPAAAAAQSTAPTSDSARPLKRKEHEAADGNDNKEDVSECHESESASPSEPVESFESASPSEPVESSAKRAKHTAPPPASSTSPRSAMLHHLSRDAGSSSALLSCLAFTDLLPLYSTCRTWREWLLLPSSCAPRRVAVRPSRFAQLLLCQLARSKVDSIVILEDEDQEVQSSYYLLRGALQLTLMSLGAFSQLRRLRVHLLTCSVDQSIWRACFQTLAPRLHTLQVVADEDIDFGQSALVSMMPAVGLLTKLERLRVYGPVAAPWHLPFDSLVHLHALREIEFLDNTDEWGEERTFRVTPEQARCLANCPNLEVLSYGRWDANPRMQAVDEETQFANTIGAVVHAIEGRQQGSSVAGCSFRQLALNATVMSAALWSWVCRLPSLTELWPLHFAALSNAEWNHLSRFSSLTSLQIHANNSSAIRVADFLPSLLQCSLLQKLSFGNLSFTTAQLQSICTSLPRLWYLKLAGSRLEGLQPLASALLLCDLTIDDCVLFNGDPLLLRANLPPLLALTRLKIAEPPGVESISALNASLLARCPKLSRELFSVEMPGRISATWGVRTGRSHADERLRRFLQQQP